MPCFRCGARQTDPVRGASPWRRGVRADHQVLVCPGCQAVHGWADGLDRCTACASAALVCRLGEVECRDCGHTREAVRDDLVRAAAPGGTGDRDLSAEVAAALSRVLSRGPAG
ncbi:hypothetical protein [Actinomadura sp. WMMB 499]|uniref:hypothetical protein n=1 Tax=Actinomadura sp. WMMB 499 TaxID=1219491 RepID=UPI001245505D|nr:hypothetical protein [Actinomadura sp. WMMB 499]QFG20926.1 hypothetical protein F7P10_07010 [Actinomadura sp. WMMB 499]